MTSTIIGLLGCGNIGGIIARATKDGELAVEIGALFDSLPARSRALAQVLGRAELSKRDFEEFLDSPIQVVVEAASIEAVRQYGERILQKGKDLVVLSVGAFLDGSLRSRLVESATSHGRRIIVPSGAIGGLDLLKACAMKGVESVSLTTTKNPRSLPGAGAGARRKVIFRGDASEAVKLFPENINVAASLALASGCDVKVKIVADPKVHANVHEVRIRGDFGHARFMVSNVPSPDNPRTSYLAALSVIRSIRGMQDCLVIGT